MMSPSLSKRAGRSRHPLQNSVKFDTSQSHRIVGMRLHTQPLPICFLGPSRLGCTDEFKECLDHLDSLIGFDNEVIILVDINADPGVYEPPNKQDRILRRYFSATLLGGTSFLCICTSALHKTLTHTSVRPYLP